MIENEERVKFKGKKYLVLCISMHDEDYEADIMDYNIGNESLRVALEGEIENDRSLEAEEIDEGLFHCVPDELLESRDAEKIIREIVSVTGFNLKNYKGE